MALCWSIVSWKLHPQHVSHHALVTELQQLRAASSHVLCASFWLKCLNGLERGYVNDLFVVINRKLNTLTRLTCVKAFLALLGYNPAELHRNF